MGKKWIGALAIMALFLLLSPTVSAYNKPKVDMWFTWEEESKGWHDWVGCTQENKSILYNLQLKIGQPVKCKIEVHPYYNCSIDFELTEVGDTNAYTVTIGKEQDKLISYKEVYADENISYIWTLQPNGKWTGGNAPINIYWQVTYWANVDVPTEYESGSYAFANPTIVDEEWQGGDGDDDGSDTGDNGNTSGDNGGGIPGFETMTTIAALGAAMAVAIFSQKKSKK